LVVSIDATPPPVPYADWPIFPFEGDIRAKSVRPPLDADLPRSGEPGGQPCGTCASDDDSYVWVDEHWRVRAGEYPTGVPVQLFLESREHVDLDGLDDERAAELGKLIVRLDRVIQSVGGIGRVHVNRWGDGGSHFHLWFFARPVGVWQMMGFFMPIWAKIYPPTPADVWQRNLVAIARHLAADGGTAIIEA
jgi:hypothetical protein